MSKKKRRIPEPAIPSRIPEPQPKDSNLVFSFKYLDLNHAKFSIRDDKNYLSCLYGRLKALSGMKLKDFFNLQYQRGGMRVHTIDFSETTEAGFSNLSSQLQDLAAWQFSISANEHGRVHGFLIDHIFNVVWFDPDHQLYATK